MPDIAQARAEKAYPRCICGRTDCEAHEHSQRKAYILGWTESQREPISDAEVEAAAAAMCAHQGDSWVTNSETARNSWRAEAHSALTAAAKARVSAESEKP